MDSSEQVERRRGGGKSKSPSQFAFAACDPQVCSDRLLETTTESGVVAVTYYEGQPVWDAADAGVWSLDLAEAACAAIGELAPGAPGVIPGGTMKELCKFPVRLLLICGDPAAHMW